MRKLTRYPCSTVALFVATNACCPLLSGCRDPNAEPIRKDDPALIAHKKANPKRPFVLDRASARGQIEAGYREYHAALKAGDFQKCDSIFTEDVVWRGASGQTLGRSGLEGHHLHWCMNVKKLEVPSFKIQKLDVKANKTFAEITARYEGAALGVDRRSRHLVQAVAARDTWISTPTGMRWSRRQFHKVTDTMGGRRVPNPFGQDPSWPQRRIYVVPIGDLPELVVRNAIGECEDRLLIHVAQLPWLRVDDRYRDASGKQLVCENLIDLIGKAYPKQRNDPNVVLIGITGEDMGPRDKSRLFQFSFRGPGRIAVISSARMDPVFFREAPDSSRMQRRLRKILLKQMCLLCLNMEPSKNKETAVFDNITGLSDLDAMGDSL